MSVCAAHGFPVDLLRTDVGRILGGDGGDAPPLHGSTWGGNFLFARRVAAATGYIYIFLAAT